MFSFDRNGRRRVPLTPPALCALLRARDHHVTSKKPSLFSRCTTLIRFSTSIDSRILWISPCLSVHSPLPFVVLTQPAGKLFFLNPAPRHGAAESPLSSSHAADTPSCRTRNERRKSLTWCSPVALRLSALARPPGGSPIPLRERTPSFRLPSKKGTSRFVRPVSLQG